MLHPAAPETKGGQVVLACPAVPPTVAYPFHDDDGACMHVGSGAFITFAFAACSRAALFAGHKLQSRACCRQC